RAPPAGTPRTCAGGLRRALAGRRRLLLPRRNSLTLGGGLVAGSRGSFDGLDDALGPRGLLGHLGRHHVGGTACLPLLGRDALAPLGRLPHQLARLVLDPLALGPLLACVGLLL